MFPSELITGVVGQPVGAWPLKMGLKKSLKIPGTNYQSTLYNISGFCKGKVGATKKCNYSVEKF